ncbi:MAG: hypothetical protein KAV87_51520 [Desulfobacteraceae bacterium]|nr:hypothetical protein [Desulfobacteraceae bacterium]
MKTFRLPNQIAENIANFTGRRWLLPPLLEWFEKTNDRMFILQGKPGSGKSMIAAWLSGAGPEPIDNNSKSHLQQIRSRIKATHFCIEASGSIAPKAFTKNIADQLTRNVKGFSDALVATLSDQVIISGRADVGQVAAGGSATGLVIEHLHLGTLSDELSFDRVLRESLKILYESGHNAPMILLVDGLDEAEIYTSSPTIVRLLTRLTDLPNQIRILVTTRPDPRVLKHYHGVTQFDIIKDAPNDNEDVRRYAFEQMCKMDNAERNYLADRIAQSAEGNFLYAHLILDELLSRLPDIPDLDALRLPKGLSGLYHEFLNRELGEDEDRWHNEFKPIFGLIAVAQGEGLSWIQLTNITGKEKDQSQRILRIGKQYLDGELREGPFRPFHRSFAEFLLDEEENFHYHIDAVAMHCQIADYYMQHFNDRWSDCDEYGLRYLSAHLEFSGQIEALHRLLASETSDKRNVWYEAKESIGDTEGYFNDIMRAWQLAEKAYISTAQHAEVGRYIGLQIRYALIISSLNSLSTDIPPSLLSALVERGVWSPIQALTKARLKTRSSEKADALTKLAPHLSEPLLKSALQIAQAIQGQRERGAALAGLIPWLAELGHAQEALNITRAIDYQFHRAAALVGLVRHLPLSLLPEAQQIAIELEFAGDRAKALTAIAPRLSDPLKTEILRKALESVRAIEPKPWGEDSQKVIALIALASHLNGPLLHEALGIAYKIHYGFERGKALAGLIPRLAKLGHTQEALNKTRSLEFAGDRAKALTAIAPRLKDPLKTEILREALESIRAIEPLPWSEGTEKKIGTLIALVPHLPPSLLPDVGQIVQELQYASDRTIALSAIASHLSDPLKSEVLKDAPELETLAEHLVLKMEGRRAGGFAYLAKEFYEIFAYLVEPLKSQLLERMLLLAKSKYQWGEEFHWNSYFPKLIIETIAPHLQKPLLQQAVTLRNIEDDDWQAAAVARLIPYLSTSLTKQMVNDVFEIQQVKQCQFEYHQLEGCLAKIAPLLPETFEKAVRTGHSKYGWHTWAWADVRRSIIKKIADLGHPKKAMEAIWAIHNQSERTAALMDLVPQLLRDQLSEALLMVSKLQYEGDRARALEGVASHLSEPLLKSALKIARAIQGQEERGAALAGLIPRLAKLGHTQEALNITRSIDYQFQRAAALVGLVRHLPLSLLPEAQQIAIELEFAGDRAKALTAIAPRLSDPLKTEILRKALESVRAIEPHIYGLGITNALIALAPHLSVLLLQEALEIAQVIQDSQMQANALSEITLRLAKLGDSEKALKIMRVNNNQLFKVEALKKLAPLLSQPLMREALQMIKEFHPIYQSENDKVEALAGLAPHVPEPLWWEALQVAQTIQYAGIDPWVFIKLAAHLPELGYPEEALKLTKGISNQQSRRTASLVALTQNLPSSLLPNALEIAQKLQYDGDRAKALTAIATRLSGPLRSTVIEEALSAAWAIRKSDFAQEPHEYACAEALAELVPLLSEALLKKTLLALMKIVTQKYELYGMPNNYDPTPTATHTIKIVIPRLAECSTDISYPIWCKILHTIARRSRPDLLKDLSAIKDVILTLGGEEAALETVYAIQDVGQWWH